jgi:hypothetical protein
MIPEKERGRRGEPVILISDNREREGTIEWGGITKPASIYLEHGGRVTGVPLRDIKPDPGGKRPVWHSIEIIMLLKENAVTHKFFGGRVEYNSDGSFYAGSLDKVSAYPKELIPVRDFTIKLIASKRGRSDGKPEPLKGPEFMPYEVAGVLYCPHCHFPATTVVLDTTYGLSWTCEGACNP